MKYFHVKGRTLALSTSVILLLALFVYVALRSGPLAPVEVTVTTVQKRVIRPGLFGIGTVEVRHSYKIGPTFPGRLKWLSVDVGDHVKTGQVLGEMDPVDLDFRIHAQEAALKQAGAVLLEAEARQVFAKTQAQRYEQLLAVRSASEETAVTKRQELQIANAALSAAREGLERARSDRKALLAQRRNLRLIAPFDGLVSVRDVDPGTTVVAGQAVVEVIDPQSIWVNARFDQIHAAGLAAGLPAKIVLRSQSDLTLAGRVLRVEPVADAVTEETLAKVVFNTLPKPLPAIGELAEITISLPDQPATLVIPNAAIRRVGGTLGVWRVEDDRLHFSPIKIGISDLDGRTQVLEGLKSGDQIIVYSGKKLNSHSRIHVAKQSSGVGS